MTAKQLKNSILQMAVQGKLVPQDPNDEPASVLLERIREEKTRLIKDGKIKHDKNESAIFRKTSENGEHAFFERIADGTERDITDEIPFDVPESWEWVRLKELCKKIGSGSTPTGGKAVYQNDGVIFIRSQNVYNDGLRLDDVAYISEEINRKKSGSIVQTNDILLNITGGSIGRCAVVPNDFIGANVNQHVMIIRLIDSMINKYIHSVVISSYIQNLIMGVQVGVSREGLSASKLMEFLIPMPSFAEMKRIANHINEFQIRINEYDIAEAKLTKLNAVFPAQLKKSILQAAVQGKLVSQDPTDEPAAVLLEKIRAEREQLIREGKLKRDKNESQIFKRSNSYYETRNGTEICIDNELPFKIPDSWTWVRLETLSENIHYGFTASAEISGNAKLLRITDIQDNVVYWDSVPFCNPTEREFSAYGLNNRDIMIARTGGTIGKSYIVRNLSERAVFASYLIRVIPLSCINEEYLKIFLETPLYWVQLKKYSMGTGQPNVNGQSLKSLILPLPPPSEQHRITAKIQSILACVENM